MMSSHFNHHSTPYYQLKRKLTMPTRYQQDVKDLVRESIAPSTKIYKYYATIERNRL